MPVLELQTEYKNLSGGIEGERFDTFLQICFSRATHFSLSKSIRPHYQLVLNGAEELLAEHIVKSLEPQLWYGYPRVCHHMVQSIYRANEDSLRILSACYQDIFLKNRKKVPKTRIDTLGKMPKYAGILEDLCFWSGRTMILGTLSHEFICSTNIIDESFAGELRQIGNWSTKSVPGFCIDRVRF